MITDLHTHLWDSPEQMGPDAADRIRRSLGEPWDRPEASLAAHDSAMEPVDYAVILGFVSAHLGADVSGPQIAEYVKTRPGKYIGFAGIDPMQSDFLGRLSEAADLGLSGVVISPPAQAFHPTHSRAMKLYEKCVQMELPVFVHPGANFSPQSRLEFAQPHLFDEVMRNLPELRLVLAQIGHPWVEPTLVMLAKHRHVYADVSDVVDRPWQLYKVLLSAWQQGAIDRLLLGSNFPFSTPQKAITAIYNINLFAQNTNLPTVPREQLRLIVERDTLGCLGVTPPVPTAGDRPATTPKVKGGIG